tara:strand:- start:560 stop:1294 length:735 start_codon:yes stop_codon:yes gene_type:complete
MNNSNAEKQARVDLAAAFRLAVRFDLHEGICNHFTLRVPGTTDKYFLNPFGVHWSQVRASDLLIVDDNGEKVSGEGKIERTAAVLHGRVHSNLPHANCVLHTHMPHATALMCIDGGRLEHLTIAGLRFVNRVAYDDEFEGVALDWEEGDRVASKLGNNTVLMMSNHGVMVIGSTVGNAFDSLYFLERACQSQILAMSTGRPLKRIRDEVISHSGQQFKELEWLAEAHFLALKDVLDTEQPNYAD